MHRYAIIAFISAQRHQIFLIKIFNTNIKKNLYMIKINEYDDRIFSSLQFSYKLLILYQNRTYSEIYICIFKYLFDANRECAIRMDMQLSRLSAQRHRIYPHVKRLCYSMLQSRRARRHESRSSRSPRDSTPE